MPVFWATALSTMQVIDSKHSNLEGEYTNGVAQGSPIPLLSPSTPREDFDPHAAQSMYIYKHPYHLRYSNLEPFGPTVTVTNHYSI
ncbi:hypothetical protein TNCV_346021 [Trichonephila clavipes]|nr:hypothetical protein TNCV_346021 [Trichonephila clavipes]